MPTPGYLCVGASESLLRATTRFDARGDRRRIRLRQTVTGERSAEGERCLTSFVSSSSTTRPTSARSSAQMLSRSPFIEVVGTARDGAEALELVEELQARRRDLRSEHAGDGRRRRSCARRWRSVRCRSSSSASPRSTGEQVLAALDAGAIDFVQKPTALATEKLIDIADELRREGQGGGAARPCGRRPRHRTRGVTPPMPMPAKSDRIDIVVIGDLDRRAAGPQGRDPAASRRLPGAHRDRPAHADRLHRDVRQEAERVVRR